MNYFLFKVLVMFFWFVSTRLMLDNDFIVPLFFLCFWVLFKYIVLLIAMFTSNV